MDWLARALPTEGSEAGAPRVKDVLQGDVVTCGLDDRVGDVLPRVEQSPHGFALAVSESGVLLGRLRPSRCGNLHDSRVEDAMEEGPSTVRPDTAAGDLAERLRKRDLKTAVVTTPEGTLIGVVRRSELEELS
jgi:Mg/Co/Ni transporter MgtE